MATKKAATSKKATTKKSSAVKSTNTKVAETKVTSTKKADASKKTAYVKFVDTFTQTKAARVFIAEFLASFVFIGAIVALSFQHSQFALLFIPLTLVVMVLVVGKLSGAHVNPAVTIGAWANKMITWKQAVVNIIAQLSAGFLSWILIHNAFLSTNSAILKQAQDGGYDVSSLTSIAPKIADAGSSANWWLLVGEVVGSLIFGFGIAAAIKHREKIATAFGVGLSLMAGLIVGGAMSAVLTQSGTSAGSAILNPAAALSLQTFFQANWGTALLVWGLGPIIGMVIGMGLYRFISSEKADI